MHPLYRAMAQEQGLRQLYAAACYSAALDLRRTRRSVDRVSVRQAGDECEVAVRMKWWAWLLFGLPHLWLWWRLRRELQQLRRSIYVDVTLRVRVR